MSLPGDVTLVSDPNTGDIGEEFRGTNDVYPIEGQPEEELTEFPLAVEPVRLSVEEAGE